MKLPKLKTRDHDASLSTMLLTEDGSLIIAECSGSQRNATAAEIAMRCNLHQELIDALATIVGQEKPNKWGYDSASVALNDDWRNNARALLMRASKANSQH